MRGHDTKRFPEWADELFQAIGPKMVETDETLTRADVVELLVETEDVPRDHAEAAMQAMFDYGRLYEVDEEVRVAFPEQEGFA
ncbi:MAG: hypothetical protein ABEH80_10925 [Halobaculum sp.]|jgi:hypothetical protein